MTITVNNYLNIGNFIVNEVIGNLWLAYFVGLIALIYIMIKARSSTEVIIDMFFVYTLLVSSIYVGGFRAIIAFAILALGGFFYYIISTKIQK